MFIVVLDQVEILDGCGQMSLCDFCVVQGCVNDDGDSDRALEFTAAETDELPAAMNV